MIHQDIEKAKCALNHLQAEKREQQNRLQLAAEAKRKLENNNRKRFIQ